MSKTTKGTTQKRRSKGDGAIFPNKRGGWTSRYRKKGLPDNEFNASTKGEAKRLLDDWKVKISIEDAVTSNITVEKYAEKYLFCKSLCVEAGTYKQTSLDRLESTYEKHLSNTEAVKKTFRNLKAADIDVTILSKQNTLSHSSLRKIYLFWSGMINSAIEMGELPKSYNIMKQVTMPDESALTIATKDIQIISEEHQEIIKKVAMAYSPNKNQRYLYRYGPAILFMLNTGLRAGEMLALGRNCIVPYLGRKSVKITQTLSRVKNRGNNAGSKTKLILTPPKYPKSRRTVPLNREAEFALSCMLSLYGKNRYDESLIMTTQNGLPPNIQNLENTLKKICKRAELPNYNLRALRHTFATNLIRNTHNMGEMKEVAEIMGDDLDVVLKTYVHTNSETQMALVDTLIAC